MQIKIVESQNEIYQKQKLLGEGAFGKAYLVKRKADSELLVIKEMNIDHMSQQQRNQTIKEAQILKNLNHPNIVKFVQVYVTKQNKLKIVMEYAQCGDLSKAISDKKKNKKFFDQNQILDWFTQICLAIKHVHDRKILHRDIKGQNIFITKANTLKLGDFGIARVLNKTMEKARTVVGTPYYLSPEIIENKPYSFQSDIWSIGVVLYELCALTHPFTATSLQFLALKIVKGSFTPIPNQYSKELRGLVNSMLSLEPNKRPTINQIFKSPIIQDRIKNFLTQTKRDHEFSHTILHNHVNFSIKTQKVQIFTNKLVQVKQHKDFQKERQKLKNEEELLRQKLEQKRALQRQKAQQEQQRQKQLQKQKQKYLEKQRLRSMQKQKKQEQARKEMLQKQKLRKDYERKQSIMQEQRRKEEQQRKVQRQYEENCKMAKQIERRLKEDDERDRVRRQADLMYQYSEKQEELKRAEKMRKMQDKELQQERKKKELQQFARRQFFENQQIMRRAKQRAQQQQSGYNNYNHELPQQKPEEQAPHFGNRNTSDNFYYQQKRNSVPESPYKAQTKPEFNKDQDYGNKNLPSKNYQLSQEAEKKHSSIRQQMKKDRQNFVKNKNQHNQPEPLPQSPKKQEIKTIRAAKWQRPKSREGENSRQENEVYQKQTEPTSQDISQSKESNDRTYQFMDPKISPKDQENFNHYLFELENIMQNLNQNIEGIEKNQKASPSKISEPQLRSNSKDYVKDQAKEMKNGSQYLSQMPEVDEVIYRDDDQETFQLSLTANFQKDDRKKGEMFPQIEASTDLQLFSNFSKLQTLRMNLEDKFGTDNFVQLYRYLEKEMYENGIQAFSNQQTMVNEASRKFKIGKYLLMESFTLLLTLIHMEEKMMGNH